MFQSWLSLRLPQRRKLLVFKFILTEPAPSVQKDIIKSLKFDQTHLFVALHPFNRENLFYEVWSPNHLPSPNMALSP